MIVCVLECERVNWGGMKVCLCLIFKICVWSVWCLEFRCVEE